MMRARILQVNHHTKGRSYGRAVASLLGATLAIAVIAAHAQYAQDFGAYRVRYNALPTEHLLPNVAQTYGIPRSQQLGLVNIAVQRSADGDTAAPIRATLNGTATSLGGQRVALKFREIAEDGAVYYIAQFPISAPDTYRFDISITPESATSPYTLKFGQDFVAD